MLKRIVAQARNTKQKNKLYSSHEQNVDCISKGKDRKRYELGAKVGIAATQKEGFVTAIRSFPGNPYDGRTPDDQLQQSETLTGVTAKTMAVDLGNRGRHVLLIVTIKSDPVSRITRTPFRYQLTN